MLSDEDILVRCEKYVRSFYESASINHWRLNEVRDNYKFYSGKQWPDNEYKRRTEDKLPILVINKTAPVIDAVSGFEVQNRSEVDYSPRLPNDKQQGFSDVVSKVAKYIEQNADVPFENSQAFKDTLICGIGCVSSSIEYHENDDGEVKADRIFPGFLLFDPSARKKNLKDANWVGRAKIVDGVVLDQILDEAGQDDLITENGLVFNSQLSTLGETYLLDYFDLSAVNMLKLSVLYEIQWRELHPVYRLKNPFQAYVDDPLVMAYLPGAEEAYGFDIESQILKLDGKTWRLLKKDMDAMGVKYEKPVKQQKYKYFRALIGGDRVIEKSENFSQEQFSLNFMTGKFDETEQCYYGMLRPMRDPQVLLNMATSDMQGYLENTAKGGYNIEEDAVHDLKDFVDTATKARFVTVFKKGALVGGKAMPKVSAPLPATVIDMITSSGGNVQAVVGVTQDFMGAADGLEQSGVLNMQRVRQGLAILADYFDAKKYFTIAQGRLFIDCIRILAENSPGRLIYNVTGDDTGQYFELFADNIAQEYDVMVTDAPVLPNERVAMFEKMMGLSEKIPQMLELALDFAPLNKSQIDRAKQALQPPPPPQPDPISVAVIQSEIRNKDASSQKMMAEAEKTKAEAMQEMNKQSHVTVELENRKIMADMEQARLDAAYKTEALAIDTRMKQYDMQLKERDMQLREQEMKLKALQTELDIYGQMPELSNKLQEIDVKYADIGKVHEDAMQTINSGIKDLAKTLSSAQGNSTKSISTILERLNKNTEKVGSAIDSMGKMLAQGAAMQNQIAVQLGMLTNKTDMLALKAEKEESKPEKKAKGKRKVTVVRDDDGNIAGAEIEDD